MPTSSEGVEMNDTRGSEGNSVAGTEEGGRSQSRALPSASVDRSSWTLWQLDSKRFHAELGWNGIEAALFAGGWIWAVATAAPLLVAWLMSRLEIAPLLHYRFIISSALPLYLFAISLCGRLPSPGLRCAVAIATFAWLTAAQGSWNHWRAGEPIGSLRGEGWREAVQFLADHTNETTDHLWCHAGLVEGRSATPPLSALENEYLSYPLRACYRLAPSGRGAEIGALVGDSRRWREQIAAVLRAGSQIAMVPKEPGQLDGGTGPPISELPAAPDRIWIIHRGPGSTLGRRLEVAGLQHWPVVYPIRDFGRISLVCIRSPQP